MRPRERRRAEPFAPAKSRPGRRGLPAGRSPRAARGPACSWVSPSSAFSCWSWPSELFCSSTSPRRLAGDGALRSRPPRPVPWTSRRRRPEENESRRRTATTPPRRTNPPWSTPARHGTAQRRPSRKASAPPPPKREVPPTAPPAREEPRVADRASASPRVFVRSGAARRQSAEAPIPEKPMVSVECEGVRDACGEIRTAASASSRTARA